MAYEFKLPEIGEGLTEGEIVRWHVKEGQTVRDNDPLVSILTDKAEVEIPTPVAGKVLKLSGKPGEKVLVGAVIAVLDAGGDEKSARAESSPAASAGAPREKAPRVDEKPGKKAVEPTASPAVRRLARERGVDLSAVKPTGPGGRVTEADLRSLRASPKETGPAEAVPVPDGGEERLPFVGIRRRTAEKMTRSAAIPTVAHLDEADVTALMRLRSELKDEAARRGVKLSVLPFVIRALSRALALHPSLNSVLDEDGGVIIVKRYHNIGFATQAAQGLLVPVLHGAHALGVWEIAEGVQRLAAKVRAGKAETADLQGGTVSVTNIGPLGGIAATPLLNPPESAILAIMKVQARPVVREGGIHVRDMLNLVLVFDHRVVDGAEAAAFMNAVVRGLENPRTLL
ncbi:MAG: dihydrolipoamide acetyltransferase family protein [Elusimicrobiota bacterium]|jgi:pyruvate dehydrogenase E2 component (dihydrolipoamide acetyltransferase)